jgi:chromosome segregation ATPase
MTTYRHLLWGALGSIALLPIACAPATTTKEDVRSAHEEYEQQAEKAREAAKQADEKVGREMREAEVAREKLEQVEEDFASEQARDDFVARKTQEVDKLETRVAELKARSERLEVDSKSSLDEEIELIQEACRDARDKLDELESVEVHEWPAKRDDVELAMSRAYDHLREADQID